MLCRKKVIKYLVVISIAALLGATTAWADTLNLQTLPVTQANGYYVGAVGGNLNGGTTANYYCDDFATTTIVPSSFTVLVSSLSNISGTKFSGQTSALLKYEQAGWLMYQMQINPASVAAIQFAMWSIFDPSAPTFQDSAAWLAASQKIDPSSYDFSKMRIYTPTGSSNQEFIGGTVSAAAPELSEWMLLIVGLGLLSFSFFRGREEGAVPIRIRR